MFTCKKLQKRCNFWEGKRTGCLWIHSVDTCLHWLFVFEPLAMVILQQHLDCEAETERKRCPCFFSLMFFKCVSTVFHWVTLKFGNLGSWFLLAEAHWSPACFGNKSFDLLWGFIWTWGLKGRALGALRVGVPAALCEVRDESLSNCKNQVTCSMASPRTYWHHFL